MTVKKKQRNVPSQNGKKKAIQQCIVNKPKSTFSIKMIIHR